MSDGRCCQGEGMYIPLTDIAKYKNPDNTFVLGLWEQIYNLNFKPIEFDRFRVEFGRNIFILTPLQRIGGSDAIGIVKSGY